MKVKLFLTVLFLLIISSGIKAQIVSIPDANFKAKLLQADTTNQIAKNLSGNYFKIDANSDGEIQLAEAQQVLYLNVSSSNISALTGISDFQNIQTLNCSFNLLAVLDVQGLADLQVLNCYNNKLTSLNVQGLTNLETLNCYANLLPSLNFQGLSGLQNLNCYGNKLPSLNIQGLANLQNLNCSFNLLTSLNVAGLNNLTVLNCSSNKFVSLDMQGIPNLQNLDCHYNPTLTSINVQGLSNLMILACYGCSLPTINVQGLLNLKTFTCFENQLSALNIQGLPNLQTLSCYNNQLTTLDLHGLTNLFYLSCAKNQLATLNVQGCTGLQTMYCDNNKFTTLNVEDCISLQTLKCEVNPFLVSIFMKNGANESLSLSNNGNALKYICCDESQIADVQSVVSSLNFTNCNINSYCTFNPGGNYNTITGIVRFDENNNGCDPNDELFEHLKVKINDGTNMGSTFTNNQGKYVFYTMAGNFAITTEAENPSLFQAVPGNFNTNFANTNNNIFTQDICVKAIGNSNDLEVVMAPVGSARPGFNARYKLMWRNKGNTTLSGNVTLNFDNTKISFISSSLPYATISGNQITYSFTNLKPYQNKATEITFSVNPPTHPTNPVNIGNHLIFTADINPVLNDILPLDNHFVFNQIVTGSYDPNDIECIEGNTIPVSMVGQYLHYIVNFENTGTAPTENIVVEMNIDPTDFDINTLQLQNSSYPSYTKITGNKIEFMMKQANLGSGGHGNILMKIKSKGNLTIGDKVINKANIYFDYNFPIVTNDEITNIASLLHTSEVQKDQSVNLYPNPTKGDVNIDADSKIQSVEVFDAMGRIIQKHIGINSQNAKISVHSNINGVYYFKVNTDKGTLLKKVIKLN